jgi:hypothetical protein
VGVGLIVGITILGNKFETPCARYRKRLAGAIPQNRPNVRNCSRMGNNVWLWLLTREGLGMILCGGCDTNICCARNYTSDKTTNTDENEIGFTKKWLKYSHFEI